MMSALRDSDCLPFFLQAWRSKGAVGAILPSSRRVAEVLVEKGRLAQAGRIIELGPGSGAITGEIMERKKRGAQVLAIERDRQFARDLSSRFPDLQVVRGCASHVEEIARREGFGQADCIVSTVPWSLMEAHMKSSTLYGVRRSLSEDGIFVTAVCYGLHWLPAGRRLDGILRDVFANVMTFPVIFGSFPPMAVYQCFGTQSSPAGKNRKDDQRVGLASSPVYRRIATQRASS